MSLFLIQRREILEAVIIYAECFELNCSNCEAGEFEVKPLDSTKSATWMSSAVHVK